MGTSAYALTWEDGAFQDVASLAAWCDARAAATPFLAAGASAARVREFHVAPAEPEPDRWHKDRSVALLGMEALVPRIPWVDTLAWSDEWFRGAPDDAEWQLVGKTADGWATVLVVEDGMSLADLVG